LIFFLFDEYEYTIRTSKGDCFMLTFLEAQDISTIVIAAVLIVLCILIFRKPVGCLLRLAANTIGGFIALFILNFLGGFIGISLGITWVNALIVGILGLPGVGFLLILPWILSF